MPRLNLKLTVKDIQDAFEPYKSCPDEIAIWQCARHTHQLLAYREPVIDDNSDAGRLKRLALKKGDDHALMVCRAEIQKGMLSLSEFVEFVKWMQGFQAIEESATEG